MIPQTTLNTNLLAELTGRACEAYPASTVSIRKAQAMVLHGTVHLTEAGAFVEAHSRPGSFYQVVGKSCTCPATTPRCAHRFAVALLRRLIAEEAMPCTQGEVHRPRYYAWLNGANELAVQAEPETAPGYYTVFYRGAPWAYNIPGDMLTLLGEVDLSNEQRLADGDLVKKAAGY